MKTFLSVSLAGCLTLPGALFICGTSLRAQTGQAVIGTHDGGTSELLESIFIPPKPNAPFSLTLETEWTRPMGNGGTFTLANKRRIMRDSAGHVYQERWYLVPKGGSIEPTMNYTQIADPYEHVGYSCEVASKTCFTEPYRRSAAATYQPAIGVSGPLPNGQGFRKVEDLGRKEIEGLETTGFRETTTANPGVFGNDQPMITIREFWYSPQLGINLISLFDSPQSGKQQFTATKVSTAEPDPHRFTLPEGFSVDRSGIEEPKP
jgi:hypothetical protein